MDSKDIEQCVIGELASTDDRIVAAYLFGSVAQGRVSADSDVDVGILLKKAPSGELDGLGPTLEGDIERSVGRRTQVVILNNAPPDLEAISAT